MRQYSLYFAWLISLVAVSGSLYFSEILHFIPCDLCWFQRIFMYPLAIILGIASFKEDRSIVTYAIPLSTIGGLISFYHYLLQKIPELAAVVPCTAGVPCTGEYMNLFGFITIPFLALVAYLLITILLIFVSRNPR